MTRRGALVLLGGGVLGGAAAALRQATGAVAGMPVLARSPSGRPSPAVPAAPTAGSAPEAGAPGAALPPPTPSPEPAPQPAPPVVYQPLPGEYLPEAKRLAAAVATAVTTYGPGTEAVVVAGAGLAAGGKPDAEGAAALAGILAPLVDPWCTSTGEVVYPQCGGATPSTCSMMTVVRQTQRFTDGRGDAVTTRTLDVRLRGAEGSWRLHTVASIGGDPIPAPPGLSGEAAAVLSDPRIDLPDSCRWDVHAGRVDARLLTAMLRMADVAPFSACVLSSGHPEHVFGTKKMSHHTAGRAVDVWAVDGLPVVTQQPSEESLAHLMVRAAYDAGAAAELGSPWDLDGPGGRSFRNDVHRDHLHVAFGK